MSSPAGLPGDKGTSRPRTPPEALRLATDETLGQTDVSQLSVPTSPTSHFLSLLTTGLIDDEQAILTDKTLTRAEKADRVNALFARACADGQVDRVRHLWETVGQSVIDPNAPDDDGTTPLINAACFGHAAVADFLLGLDCKVDAADRFGWTALMWATNNHHDALVRLLLDAGADAAARSTGGRTALDMVQRGYTADTTQTQRVYEMIRASESHAPSRRISETSEPTSPLPPSTPQSDSLRDGEAGSSAGPEEGALLYRGPGTDGEFDWTQCQPDQMYVLAPTALPLFLDAVVTRADPARRHDANPYAKFVPANLLFLAARYACYFSTPDFLATVLAGALGAMDRRARDRPGDTALQAFWLANGTLLLYYLKRDPGLAVASVEAQGALAELLQTLYTTMVRSAAAALDAVLAPALLDFEAIPDLLSTLRFEPRPPAGRFGIPYAGQPLPSPATPRRSLFGFTRAAPEPPPPAELPSLRRSASLAARRQSVLVSRGAPPPPSGEPLNPRHVTRILSATLAVVRTCGLHPSFALSALAQLFHHLGAALFNAILLNPAYCSRTRALVVRMNLTPIEDWTRRRRLPVAALNDRHLGPVIQLLQLLQCYSGLQDLPAFIELTSKLDRLNPLHYRLVAEGYTYEVGETSVSQDVHEYICKVAEDVEELQRRPAEPLASSSPSEDGRRRSLQPPGARLSSPTLRPGSPHPRRSFQSDGSPEGRPRSPTSTGFGITLSSAPSRRAFDATSPERVTAAATPPATPGASRIYRSHHALFRPAHLYQHTATMTDFIDPDYAPPFAIPTPAELEAWWQSGGAPGEDGEAAALPDHPQGIVPIVPEEYLRELDQLIP
ncbi:hypothetical protein IWQ60_005422 [Tieghemiomyces parasiticus]|uniref:Dilute domain-containing protein n=1 Tax=Tieghemiomyces parasiticus TaxID=78921 RepID=A0A9W8DYH2_9FUNG|nr:hypothetical protein IWQ60_005422 [Tieghemiomyces parasiticus]